MSEAIENPLTDGDVNVGVVVGVISGGAIVTLGMPV